MKLLTTINVKRPSSSSRTWYFYDPGNKIKYIRYLMANNVLYPYSVGTKESTATPLFLDEGYICVGYTTNVENTEIPAILILVTGINSWPVVLGSNGQLEYFKIPNDNNYHSLPIYVEDDSTYSMQLDISMESPFIDSIYVTNGPTQTPVQISQNGISATATVSEGDGLYLVGKEVPPIIVTAPDNLTITSSMKSPTDTGGTT